MLISALIRPRVSRVDSMHIKLPYLSDGRNRRMRLLTPDRGLSHIIADHIKKEEHFRYRHSLAFCPNSCKNVFKVRNKED